MVKEKRKYIIIVVIIVMVAILNVIFISLRIRGKEKIIHVDGFEIEYSQTSRKMEDIEDIELGSSIQEISNKLEFGLCLFSEVCSTNPKESRSIL